MTVFRRSVSPPFVLVDRIQAYEAEPVRRRVHRRKKEEGGGESGSGSMSPAVDLSPSREHLGEAAPNDASAFVDSPQAASATSDFGRLLFADPEVALPGRPRRMTEDQFVDGVRHHWAPLLARAYRQSVESEQSLR